MEVQLYLDKILRKVSFVDALCELTVNSRNRKIHHVPESDLVRIHAFEAIIAEYTDKELMRVLAPIHTIGDEERIIAMIHALKTCTRARHPEWHIQ